MANGHGGLRVGAGRKRKSATLLRLHGSRDRSKPAKTAVEATNEPLPTVRTPEALTEAQKAVWDVLAPHALAARTLTDGTAGSFADLCRAIVTRDGILAQIEKDGWTFVKVSVDGAGVEHQELKKHPLVTEHRGWEQRVEAGRARFRLAPMGKELVVPKKEVDPFAEFDEASVQ